MATRQIANFQGTHRAWAMVQCSKPQRQQTQIVFTAILRCSPSIIHNVLFHREGCWWTSPPLRRKARINCCCCCKTCQYHTGYSGSWGAWIAGQDFTYTNWAMGSSCASIYNSYTSLTSQVLFYVGCCSWPRQRQRQNSHQYYKGRGFFKNQSGMMFVVCQ